MSGINNKITENQYSAIIHSAMIAIGILSLAQGTTLKAYQQGWIAVIIGGVYPLFIIFVSYYTDKKMNHIEFWDVSKKLYGKFLSHIIMLFFTANFIFLQAAILSGFANALNATIVPFIPPITIIIITMLITIYASIDGLTIPGRICEIFFYIIWILISIFIVFIPKGTILNIKPIFSSFKGIAAAVPPSFFAYTGVELSFIIIPFITNRKNTLKAGISATLSVIFIYAFTVFTIIYYLGWELSSKIVRPAVYVLSTIKIPVFEDFTVFFFVLWSGVILRILPTQYFGLSYCFSKAFKIDYKKSCVLSSIPILVLTYFMIGEHNRRGLVDPLTTFFVKGLSAWAMITLIWVFIMKRWKIWE